MMHANVTSIHHWNRAVLAKLRKGLYLLALLPLLSAQAGKVTYVYSNPQGTPLAEVDEQGNILAKFDYSPFGGQALGAPQPGPGYTGHVADPDTNFVYMQARYFDPAIGRFLSMDPLGLSGGDIFSFNGYAYANNSPLMYVDPDGRANKLVYLIELTASGTRKLARISKERAVIARRQGQNIQAETRQLAHEIETAANGKADQLKHAAHELEDGSRGLPHYQTEGVRGHAFWGSMASVLAWTADGLDDLSEAASYVPDYTPHPATEEDMQEWEQMKSDVQRGWNDLRHINDYYTPPKSYFKRPPPPPPTAPAPSPQPTKPSAGT